MAKRMNRKLLKALLTSLRKNPEEWGYDHLDASNGYPYEIRHKFTGIVIWMANSYYGLKVTYGRGEIGGVTFSSTFLGPLIPWRWKLLRAARSICKPSPPVQWPVDILMGDDKVNKVGKIGCLHE